ncbi:MAG: cytochrome c [Betaproteobacteria bacterium]|nr:cytochrome c [Betaproteobacteria bacterium]MBI2509407.1 cytochrome c [Betaproteobacteria bacterium]
MTGKRLALWIGAGILIGGVLMMGFAYYIQTPRGGERIALGRAVYEKNCASCHGVRLEGQPDWQRRLPNGRMPAPPHDDTGHTWHHAERVLFDITKYGLVPPHAPPGYQSDMPAFQAILSDDEIRAVLAYIKSHWSAKVMAWRAEALRNLE